MIIGFSQVKSYLDDIKESDLPEIKQDLNKLKESTSTIHTRLTTYEQKFELQTTGNDKIDKQIHNHGNDLRSIDRRLDKVEQSLIRRRELENSFVKVLIAVFTAMILGLGGIAWQSFLIINENAQQLRQFKDSQKSP